MNKKQLEKLDNLTLCLNFGLAVINSALKDAENLETCKLEPFMEILYENSEEIRKIFNEGL